MAENGLSQGTSFKDRKGGLVFFGILQILLGVFSILLLGLSILGVVMTRISGTAAGQAMSLKTMFPSFLMYTVGAVVFIWLGIGSITAKRWARALTLILSMIWLAIGALTFGFEAYLMPKLLSGMQLEGGRMPESGMAVVTFFILGFMFVLFVVLPAAFTLFFRSPHVKATCEQRDPKPRWTDQRPLPALVLSILGDGAGALTFFKMDMIEYYRALGYSDLAISQMRLAELWEIIGTRTIVVPMMIFSLAVWIGYLLYVRRFFLADPQEGSGDTMP